MKKHNAIVAWLFESAAIVAPGPGISGQGKGSNGERRMTLMRKEGDDDRLREFFQETEGIRDFIQEGRSGGGFPFSRSIRRVSTGLFPVSDKLLPGGYGK